MKNNKVQFHTSMRFNRTWIKVGNNHVGRIIHHLDHDNGGIKFCKLEPSEWAKDSYDMEPCIIEDLDDAKLHVLRIMTPTNGGTA